MPRILVAASLAAALAVAVVAAGCGSSGSSGSTGSTSSSASKPAAPTGKEQSPAGDIPDNQAYVAYRGSGYSVKVPEGWARTGAGGAVTFTDKLNSVRIDESQAAGAAARKPAGARLTTVSRPAGRAARITYVAKSAPDPVTGRRVTDAVERYVFAHGGRAVVLTLSGPTGADNVDPWKLITTSLRWTR
jgi:hypothetical protein